MKKLLFLILGLIVVAVVIASVTVYLARGGAPALADDLVLRLHLTHPVADYAPAPVVPFFGSSPSPSLIDIYRGLRAARDDERVKALVVHIQWASFGLAQAEEIRRQIQGVAATGKQVDCYLETAGEGTNGTLAYYVASACPRITLAPAGELNAVGFFLDSTFVRGTLDKLRIEPEFESVGTYKSAAEYYTETAHSTSARESLSSLLDDLYSRVVADLAAGRSLSEERIRELIDAAPYSAAEALELGLVDALGYPDELEDRLDETLGDDWRWVELGQYRRPTRTLGTSKIAVVFAQGTIVRGSSGFDPWTRELYIGSDGLGRVLDELLDDDSVAAVILRVDSPGGSAQASDLLLRRVERLAQTKPVIVSMSSLAASGGYYISAKARHIVAEATTLTGSIGVVAGRLLTREFQRELLGITHDSLQRGANADFFSSLEPFDPDQRRRFVELMEGIYDTFVDHVAAGRRMERQAVLDVARGRIWSGSSALGHGLVDEIGGFDAAREAAAEALGVDVEDTRFVLYPRPPRWLDLLTGGADRGVWSTWLRRLLGDQMRAPLGLEAAPEAERLSHPF